MTPTDSPALRDAMWQCFTLAGGDTDGRTSPDGISDACLIRSAVDCVRGLRECYDEALTTQPADRADAEDAARYRWLRQQHQSWTNRYGVVNGDYRVPDALDAAIDAALRATQQPNDGGEGSDA